MDGARGQFLGRLAGLSRGDLATLRREAGNTLGESRRALGLFYRMLPPSLASGRHEEVCFLVATLFALNDRPHSGDFGTTMRDVRAARGGGPRLEGENEGPIDRRMRVLLDSDFERVGGRAGGGELAYRLRQCVSLARSAEVGVDWGQLLDDLTRWDLPERRVQKRWARSYYSNQETATEPTSEEGADNAA